MNDKIKIHKTQQDVEIAFLRELYNKLFGFGYTNLNTKEMDLVALRERIEDLLETEERYRQIKQSLNFVKNFLK